jgi:hypothetical protein
LEDAVATVILGLALVPASPALVDQYLVEAPAAMLDPVAGPVVVVLAVAQPI